MRPLLALLFAFTCAAQTNITITPSVLTAKFDFNSPDAGVDCNIDITYNETVFGNETPDWTKVLDVTDRTRFPNRSVFPSGSIHRTGTVGAWTTDIAADGYEKQNMMLPGATRLWARITCGGNSPVVKEFRTLNYPFGFTYKQPQTTAANGGTLMPSACWDVVNCQKVNHYGNIESFFSHPGIVEAHRDLGWTFNVAIGTPVPVSGSSWTVGSVSATDGSYLIYDGTTQDKCFIPAAGNGSDPYNLLNRTKVTLTGCSGTGTPVVVNACLSTDGLTCTGKTKPFTLGAGSTLSCSSPTVQTLPSGTPQYDMWQNENRLQTSNAGFLVWASTNASTRILIDSAAVEYQKSSWSAQFEGGFAHQFQQIPVLLGGKNRHLLYGHGGGNVYPSLWMYTPADGTTIWLGSLYQGGDNPPQFGINTALWSHYMPAFMIVSNLTGGLESMQLGVPSDGVTPKALNDQVANNRKVLFPSVRNSLKAFMAANIAKYPGFVSANLDDCAPFFDNIVAKHDPLTGKDYDVVGVTCRTAAPDAQGNNVAQDGYQTVFQFQIDGNLSESESADTKVVAALAPQVSKNINALPIHSVFVGRGLMQSLDMTGASPKTGPGDPMHMTVSGGNLTSGGGTTVELVSPCLADPNPLPCQPTTRKSQFDIIPGMLLVRITGNDFECAYVNTVLKNTPSTDHYRLTVSRDWCTSGDGYPDNPANNPYYGQKTWSNGDDVIFRPSFLGRLRNGGRNWIPIIFWNYIKDPFGEKVTIAAYNSTSHDNVSMNYVDGGSGVFLKTGVGTFAVDEAPSSGSNFGSHVRRVHWAGTYHSGSDGNYMETHPSRAQDLCYGIACDFEYDVYPFLGGGGLVTATTHYAPVGFTPTRIWKLGSMTTSGAADGGVDYTIKPNIKGSGFQWAQGVFPMRQISGPGVMITDANTYNWCYAYRAGICVPGSTLGDAFAMMPASPTPSDIHVSGLDDANPNCQGGEFNKYYNNTCAGNLASTFDNGAQAGSIRAEDNVGKLGDSSTTPGIFGSGFVRPLTDTDRTFMEKGPFTNMRTDPTGTGLLTTNFRGSQGFYSMVKVPPVAVFDYNRRDQPIEFSVPIRVPAGLSGTADNAIVEFGYNLSLYCVGQEGGGGTWDGIAETCVKGNQPIQWYDYTGHTYIGSEPGNNFDFAADSVTGVSCTTTCTVKIPVIPLRTVYYRYKIRAGSTVLLTSHTCTSEATCMSTIPY